MDQAAHRAVENLFRRFATHPEVAAVRHAWGDSESKRETLYHRAMDALAGEITGGEADIGPLLELQRELFLELEAYIGRQAHDSRHAFVVVIPVADRPRHLRTCLDSLLWQCRSFRYGGWRPGAAGKIQVLLADDSAGPANSRHIDAVAKEFDARGLPTRYFGPREQAALVEGLDAPMNGVLGEPERCGFRLKGASATRNIAYLKLREAAAADDRTLFWFIDSDQEFAVHGGSPEAAYCPSYFHAMDRIFRETDVQVLTGKVVGDPPVSPAVMAGNFLVDLIGFLSRAAALDPHRGCVFHGSRNQAGDAAYHDMADLFGFRAADQAFDYPCPLAGEHSVRDGFADFCTRLGAFFDGAHATRKTAYEHADLMASVRPARTVYSGNYVLKSRALRYYIPFANLRLRMAGPVLGRFMRAELGPRFVSANLPMLHRRTVADTGRSEFRAGVLRGTDAVDLSAELERQYFGDVMLFSVERLTNAGYPAALPAGRIASVIEDVEAELRSKYLARRERVEAALGRLETLSRDPAQWWNRLPELADSRAALAAFIRDMGSNFDQDSAGYRMILDPEHNRRRRKAMVEALRRYPDERAAWEAALGAVSA